MVLTIFTRLIVFLFIVSIYLNSYVTSFALDNTLMSQNELSLTGFTKYESINPNLMIYPIKQIVEKIELSLLFKKDDKLKYQYNLLDKRFNELVYIINFKKTGFLEETVARYNALIGTIIKNNKNSALDYKDKLSGYIKILKTLQDRYDSLSSYRLLIQYAIDTTRRLN